MEPWTPREAVRYTPIYFLFVLTVVTVLELLFYDVPATLGDAVVRSLPVPSVSPVGWPSSTSPAGTTS